MSEENFGGDIDGVGDDGLPATKPKWQIRFSESDSPYASGYMPLESLGEMLWRSPTGSTFTVYDTDQDFPSKTSRILAALVHRLRSENGADFRISTRQAVLFWTEFESQDEPEKDAKRVVNIPRDKTRRVIMCTVLNNPVYNEWVASRAAAAAAAASEVKRPPGRPPKPKTEDDQPKRPRGRPRKTPPPDSGQLDL